MFTKEMLIKEFEEKIKIIKAVEDKSKIVLYHHNKDHHRNLEPYKLRSWEGIDSDLKDYQFIILDKETILKCS